MIRLGVLLLLFDVYLTWARIEKQTPSASSESSNFGQLAQQPIMLQYLFFRASSPLRDTPRRIHAKEPPNPTQISLPLPHRIPPFPPHHSPPNPDSMPVSPAQQRQHCSRRFLLYQTLSNSHGNLGL